MRTSRALEILVVLIGVSALAGAAGPVPGAPGDEVLVVKSVCSADCGEYADVSCSGTTCNAVDRNCAAGQRGYVVCSGTTIYCPVCPAEPECTTGETKTVHTGICCDFPDMPDGEMVKTYRCINGSWSMPLTGCFASPLCAPI
jgi:hypothetical protein